MKETTASLMRAFDVVQCQKKVASSRTSLNKFKIRYWFCKENVDKNFGNST